MFFQFSLNKMLSFPILYTMFSCEYVCERKIDAPCQVQGAATANVNVESDKKLFKTFFIRLRYHQDLKRCMENEQKRIFDILL